MKLYVTTLLDNTLFFTRTFVAVHVLGVDDELLGSPVEEDAHPGDGSVRLGGEVPALFHHRSLVGSLVVELPLSLLQQLAQLC